MLKIQDFSYHSHTTFSDGHDTAVAMIRRAKAIGFSELGISDHLMVHKNMRQSRSCRVNPNMLQQPEIYCTDFKQILESFQRHCDELRQLSKAENFKIRIGFEVDFFTYNGWFEELQWFLAQLDYDYIITGNHFLFDENCAQLINLTDLPKLYRDKAIYQDYLQRHFQTMAQAVNSGLFKFLAHIDYARKLGDDICGPDDFLAEKIAILNALEASDCGMEISTKGLRKVGDFYPSGNILAEVAKRKIAMVISDDAHQIGEVGANFADAEATLQKYGICRRLHF